MAPRKASTTDEDDREAQRLDLVRRACPPDLQSPDRDVTPPAQD